MDVRDLVEERDDQVQPRLERAFEAPQAFDHPGALLRNDAYAFDHEGDDDADEQNPTPVVLQARHLRGDDRGYDGRGEFPKHSVPPLRVRRLAAFRRRDGSWQL